jgi:hypothetical protein
MSVSDSAFPASAAFQQIADGLKNSEADKKDAISKAKAIFAFTLKNKDGQQKSWYIDLKNKGEVGEGLAPAGDKANGMFPRYIINSRFRS